MSDRERGRPGGGGRRAAGGSGRRLAAALALAWMVATATPEAIGIGSPPAEGFVASESERALGLLREQARTLERDRRFEAADTAFAAAVQAFRLWGRPREAAETLIEWAQSLDRRVSWDAALLRLGQAETLLPPVRENELVRARLFYERGEVLRHRDDYPAAAAAHRSALALRSAAAPGSLDHAASLFASGRVLAESGTGDALPFVTAAEVLFRRLDPGSSDHSMVLGYWGILTARRDPVLAEALHREALEWARRRAPGTYAEGLALQRLGGFRSYLGDLLGAQELLEEALAVARKLPEDFLPRTLLVTVLRQRASLDVDQGDEMAGYALAQQAVQVQRRLNPRSLGLAFAFGSLGKTAWMLGRPQEAEEHFRQAIGLLEQLVPDNPDLALLRVHLARVLAEGGKPEEGRWQLDRARTVYESRLLRTLSYADFLRVEGLILEGSGRFEAALERMRRAVGLLDQIDPESLDLAEALGSLATGERGAGLRAEARAHACRAAALVERQGETYGGEEVARRRLAHRFYPLFAHCAEALLEAGELREAFRVVEAGRARALLDALAARRRDGQETPPEIRIEEEALRGERDAIAAALEEAVAAGDGGGDAGAAAKRAELRRRLEENARSRARLVERTRVVAAAYAAFRYPQALPLGEVRKALDPGTLLLEYSLGETQSYLLLVRPQGAGGEELTVHRLPIGLAALRDKVEVLGRMLATPLSEEKEVEAESRELYRQLLAPAEREIAAAKRLLIVPDGPLHALSFAALRRADGRHLVEWKPLSSSPSAAAYAEMKGRRRPLADPARLRLAAFGDPRYAPATADRPPRRAELRLRAFERRGFPLGPLPQSRGEVEALLGLFPQGSAFLGAAASEGAARALPRDLDVVHFAVHALLDAESPYRSALVLSPPDGGVEEGDDGIFEAHEILRSLRLDSHLVTLSACETALGQAVAGEGLVGLARAFQLAGARSILASLWAVGDRATARLMPLFYAALRSGAPKDEALRQAQLLLLREPATAHPAHWAGFVLLGDDR